MSGGTGAVGTGGVVWGGGEVSLSETVSFNLAGGGLSGWVGEGDEATCPVGAGAGSVVKARVTLQALVVPSPMALTFQKWVVPYSSLTSD